MILEKKLYSRRYWFGPFLGALRASKRVVLRWILRLLGKTSHLWFSQKENSSLKGLPYLLINEENQLACTSCGLCEDICPSQCIHLVTKDENPDSSYGGPPENFSLEILKCLFCGFCEDICPEDAIRMGPETSLAGHAEQNWVWDQRLLAFRSSLNEGRGVRVGEAHPKI